MNDHNLALHPEFQRLLEEVALLREELAARLAELFDLQHVVKPNLLALYQAKLGRWALRLLEAQAEIARMKRKTELVQASLNRGVPPDLVAIDTALEVEFLAWKQQLLEAAENIEQAQFRLSHLLSPGEDAELKKVYHGLVKKLHPDVNPELSREQKELWLQAVAAYEAGDLKKLQALALLTEQPGATAATAAGLEALRAEHERLGRTIRQLVRQIEEIEDQPPFSMRREWEDDEWIAQRREELDQQVAALREQLSSLEKHLQALLILHGPGKQFGHN